MDETGSLSLQRRTPVLQQANDLESQLQRLDQSVASRTACPYLGSRGGASTDHREEGDSTDRLALAIRLASNGGFGEMIEVGMGWPIGQLKRYIKFVSEAKAMTLVIFTRGC